MGTVTTSEVAKLSLHDLSFSLTLTLRALVFTHDSIVAVLTTYDIIHPLIWVASRHVIVTSRDQERSGCGSRLKRATVFTQLGIHERGRAKLHNRLTLWPRSWRQKSGFLFDLFLLTLMPLCSFARLLLQSRLTSKVAFDPVHMTAVKDYCVCRFAWLLLQHGHSVCYLSGAYLQFLR